MLKNFDVKFTELTNALGVLNMLECIQLNSNNIKILPSKFL